MPPRKSTRTVSASTSRTVSARGRKVPSPSSEVDSESDEGFPGEESEKEVVQPRSRRSGASAATTKPAAKTTSRTAKSSAKTAPKVIVKPTSKTSAAPTRRSTRTSGPVDPEPVDDTPSPKSKPTKGRAKKLKEESEEEELEDALDGDAERDQASEGDEVEEDDDEETLKPSKPVKAIAKPTSRGKKAMQQVEVEQEEVSDAAEDKEVEAVIATEEEDTDETPAPKRQRTSVPSTPQLESNDEEEDMDKTPSRPAKRTASEKDEDEATERGHLESTPDLADIPHPTPAQPFPSPTPNRSTSFSSMGTPFQPTPSKLPSTPAPAAAPPPPAKPKARLTIHKLVLVNFKSYAGRQEIGPFHKSFSAIVGPNGSGKSNTIDALLFVFGYRASKMRQGKLSELIHNSAGKEGLESCSVEVWFREIVDLPGSDNFLLVPNSQLVVNRTAYKNNSSKYTINDQTSSFSEVTTLLKGKGIDLDHNRFLILQGEVESIAQMKAKAQNEHEDGLLEYLEDIIGTTKYKEPIEQASQEVETLNEERGEKMNRLRVVEREKAALEDKKREAEDFLRDTNELTRKKSLLWQYHMNTLQSNLDITSKAIESLTAQLGQEQERNAGLLAEIEELEKGYQEKLAAFDEVKRLTDALIKDSKKFEKEEVGLSEKRKHLITKQKKMKKGIADDGHARSEALSAIDNYSTELETNRTKVANLEKKLEDEEAELEEVRDSLKDKTDQFTTQIEVKQRELEPWTAKISEKQSAIDIATSERDALVSKATGAQTALEEARKNLEELKAGGEGKQDSWKELKTEMAKAKRDLASAESQLEAMTAQGDKLRNKVSATRSKTDEAKSSLAADKSENAVLSSLNKLRAQGRIKGFHGRLGDLGTIDDKYDVAVTTACGALNNLVVDTVDQGQACIEHLRRNNVGRASFMVLEKLPPRDLNPIETPEGVPRLFDLIKFKDPRFAPAFFKGVFNTLVAEDLVQAQRIGYGKKRWRVVTLAGQLIDPSGTMSGGGTRVSRGGMSSKLKGDTVAPEVIARYEQESSTAEAEFMEFQRDRRSVEEEVSSLKRRIPEIEIEMEKIELDVKTGGKRVAEAEQRLTELKSQNKPDAADEKRIKTLNSEIASLEAEVSKLRQKSSGINEQIKELQNKILEVGGVKLRAIQSKVTTTKGLLDLANESITKAEVGQAKSQRDAEKFERNVEGNKVKMREVEAELEVVQSDLDGCSRDLAVLKEKVQEAVDASADVQEGLAESKKELDETMEGINAFRAIEMDIKQKMEDNVRLQKDAKNKLDHWQKRHDELELVYVDDDDDEEASEKPIKSEMDQVAQEMDGEELAGGDEVVQKNKKKPSNDSMELVEYSPDELRAVDKEMLNAEITQLEEDIGKAKPNLNVLAEYRRREAEFLDRAKDMEAVTSQRDNAKKRYDDLRKVRLDEFMAGFSAISSKLKEMYQMITMGGNAEIELIDSMDPFSEGVVLSIMPPKKSWRAIANLSGGEKTLASLALVFALHVFKPTPLYFMDEIDAALDFKNVSIVANYIQSKTQAAQFIVISLRNDMFELAHRLVGIYKTSNATKSVAIDNKDLRMQARPPAPRRPLGPGSPDKRRRPSTLTVPNTIRKAPPSTPMAHA